MKKDISVVVMTSRGPRHSYFCHELAKHYDVKAVVIDDRYHFSDRLMTFLKLNSWNPIRMIRSIVRKSRIADYEKRDLKTENDFFAAKQGKGEFPKGAEVSYQKNPNGAESKAFIGRFKPDVIAVFGTRLIKDDVLELAREGALNIHTGYSPFYRGGQCTFWALNDGDLDHVGVTIHHLTSRIDGGDIIYVAQPAIEGDDTVRSIECKLIEVGTQKMIEAIGELVTGTAPRVPQKDKGKLFLSKQYTLEARLAFEEKMSRGWLKELILKQQEGKVHEEVC